MDIRKSAHTDPVAANGGATPPATTPEPSTPSASGEGSNPPTNGNGAQATSPSAQQRVDGIPIVDLMTSLPQQPRGPGRPRGPNYGQPRSHKRQGERSKPREFNPSEPQAQVPLDPRDGGPMHRQSKVVDYHAMGVMCVDVVTGVAQQLGGAEWRPSTDEYTNLTNATETYLRAKEFPDIPPGWVLCFVVCGYALPRLNSPTMREKLGRVGDKIKGAFRMGAKRG
jgi:hypothetical protein